MPEGKRFAVCLSFDFDGLGSYFSSFGLTTPQAIGRGEYSARVAVERVLELLARHGLTSTWFVPGHSAETWPAVARAIAEAGHEIAHHGYIHESPLGLSREEEEAVLVRGIESLGTVLGRRPVGYRSPIWDMTDNTVDLLLKHGFTYSANGMADDYRPYPARIGDVVSLTEPFKYGKETALLEIPSAWYLSDLIQLEIVYQFPHRIPVAPSEVERIWFDEFNYGHESAPGGVLTYTWHPDGIGRPHRFVILRRLIEHMASQPDVWFPQMHEVRDAWTPDAPGLWTKK
jgi:peptidoglycan/xylan/chitin deacetylase (PgdA/CDA1 family)